MNNRILIIAIAVLFVQIGAWGQKAEPNKTVVLKINDKTIELVNSKMKIADLKNAKVELFCNDKSVGIVKHEILYSSKELNKVGELKGEGAPKDISTFKWTEDVQHKHIHSGSLMMLKLFYVVDYIDEAGSKDQTWMIELE